MADQPVLCPECGHSINQHGWDGCEWYRLSEWCSTFKSEECTCKSEPSDITRALLAESSDAERAAWLKGRREVLDRVERLQKVVVVAEPSRLYLSEQEVEMSLRRDMAAALAKALVDRLTFSSSPPRVSDGVVQFVGTIDLLLPEKD